MTETLEQLKSKFLVSDNLTEAKMLSLLQLAVKHCTVDTSGAVDIKNSKLSAKDRILLVLVARLIAHSLNESIVAECTTEDLVSNAGVAAEQVRARASDLARDKQLTVVSRGVYRALLYKAEPFLESLAG